MSNIVLSMLELVSMTFFLFVLVFNYTIHLSKVAVIITTLFCFWKNAHGIGIHTHVTPIIFLATMLLQFLKLEKYHINSLKNNKYSTMYEAVVKFVT